MLRERLWRVVDPCDKPTLVCLVDAGDPRATEMFDEFRERDPAGGVHVEMVLVLDEFLVHPIRKHPFGSEPE